jgi:hypothetical protein
MSGTLCTVCDSPRLEEINAALDAGKGVRAIGKEFGFSKSTIHRHSTVCRIMLQARTAVLARRGEERADRALQAVITSTADRLAPIDSLARDLMDFISSQVSSGKVPNMSLVKTFLSAQEIGLKAQFGLEQRQGASPVASGLLEAGRTIAFLAEHYPDALAALRAHLEAVA